MSVGNMLMQHADKKVSIFQVNYMSNQCFLMNAFPKVVPILEMGRTNFRCSAEAKVQPAATNEYRIPGGILVARQIRSRWLCNVRSV